MIGDRWRDMRWEAAGCKTFHRIVATTLASAESYDFRVSLCPRCREDNLRTERTIVTPIENLQIKIFADGARHARNCWEIFDSPSQRPDTEPNACGKGVSRNYRGFAVRSVPSKGTPLCSMGGVRCVCRDGRQALEIAGLAPKRVREGSRSRYPRRLASYALIRRPRERGCHKLNVNRNQTSWRG